MEKAISRKIKKSRAKYTNVKFSFLIFLYRREKINKKLNQEENFSFAKKTKQNKTRKRKNENL